jgi:hypothetical protein
LRAVYPEYKEVWDTKKRGYWKDVQSQKVFFDQLAVKLNIQKPEDWLKVKCKQVTDEGGSFVNAYYNSSVLTGNILSYESL